MIKPNSQSAANLAVSHEHCEKAAAEMLDIGKIAKRIIEVSKQGYYYCRIVQERPIPLRHTKHAKKTVKALKEEGYQVEWVTVVYPAKDKKNPLGVDLNYQELAISWDEIPVVFAIETAKMMID